MTIRLVLSMRPPTISVWMRLAEPPRTTSSPSSNTPFTGSTPTWIRAPIIAPATRSCPMYPAPKLSESAPVPPSLPSAPSVAPTIRCAPTRLPPTANTSIALVASVPEKMPPVATVPVRPTTSALQPAPTERTAMLPISPATCHIPPVSAPASTLPSARSRLVSVMLMLSWPALERLPTEGATMPLATTPPDCQLSTATLPIAAVEDSTMSRTLPSTMLCTAPCTAKLLTGSVLEAVKEAIGPDSVTPSRFTRPLPPTPLSVKTLVASVPVISSVGSAAPCTTWNWPGPVSVAVTLVSSASRNSALPVPLANTVPAGTPDSSSRGS